MEGYPVLRDTKNMVTMSILPKAIFKYKTNLVKFQWHFPQKQNKHSEHLCGNTKASE